MNEDPKKHKFKFEGIIIDSIVEDKKIREIFDNCIMNRIKVKGNAIKREVVFNFAKKTKLTLQEINPLNEKNLTDQTTEVLEKINQNFPIKQNGNDRQTDTQLQDMKMELHKYKNQLNSLIDTHKNLKNRVEMEKSKDIQSNLNGN